MSTVSFGDQTLDAFLDGLASDRPTPGGGVAAALAGGLAAALGRMVCAYTVGKPKFAAVDDEVRGIDTRLARAGVMFRRLMDEDAAAYGLLRDAFTLPRDDPQRTARIEQAAGLAGTVPLETAALAARVAWNLERLRQIANPMLGADNEAALHMARAASRAAAANVRANLPYMEAKTAGEIRRQIEAVDRGA